MACLFYADLSMMVAMVVAMVGPRFRRAGCDLSNRGMRVAVRAAGVMSSA